MPEIRAVVLTAPEPASIAAQGVRNPIRGQAAMRIPVIHHHPRTVRCADGRTVRLRRGRGAQRGTVQIAMIACAASRWAIWHRARGITSATSTTRTIADTTSQILGGRSSDRFVAPLSSASHNPIVFTSPATMISASVCRFTSSTLTPGATSRSTKRRFA